MTTRLQSILLCGFFWLAMGAILAYALIPANGAELRWGYYNPPDSNCVVRVYSTTTLITTKVGLVEATNVIQKTFGSPQGTFVLTFMHRYGAKIEDFIPIHQRLAPIKTWPLYAEIPARYTNFTIPTFGKDQQRFFSITLSNRLTRVESGYCTN
jgi:hypothetical protein